MPAEHLTHSTSAPARSLRTWIVSQFGRPHGAWGHLAGWIMARRPSNRQRNAWTVDRLNLAPGERVLEIGFGPGLALVRAARAVGPSGFVGGIDHSAAMLAQATRRNATAIAERRMDLRQATIERLPDFSVAFDAICAINTIDFWPDPVERLRELMALLTPGGRLAVTVQPRTPGADASVSARVARRLEQRLRAAGFVTVETEFLDLAPPAVCVMGRNG